MEGNRPEDDCIKVCVRLRPRLQPYQDQQVWAVSKKTNSIYSTVNPQHLQTSLSLSDLNEMSLQERQRLIDAQSNQLSFSFDHLQGQEARTQAIYTRVGRQIVRSVLDGYHGSILCYGQTTSGKTFTMLGTPENPGILPCSIRDIFMEIDKRDTLTFNMWISYMQIYNENVNDLLSPSTGNNLKIQDDPKWGVSVQGMQIQRITSFEQAIMLMNFGEEHRKYRETSIHQHSSRSHTIFRIYIESHPQDLKMAGKKLRYSCLNLVDLAGSERLNEYEGQSESTGETGYINQSLFVLANVINKLAGEQKAKHIPYRDSKLTRLLSQALGGNSMTSIICCVSPALCNYGQTLSTLRFALRAKTVLNKPQINETQNAADVLLSREDLKKLQENISFLQRENLEKDQINENLKTQIKSLEQTVGNMNTEILRMSQNLEGLKNEKLKLSEKERETDYSQISRGQMSSPVGSRQIMETNKYLNKETTFIENLLFYVNSVIEESFRNPNNNQISNNEKETYFEHCSNLSSSYKTQLLALQTQFRQLLQTQVKKVVKQKQQFNQVSRFFEVFSSADFNEDQYILDFELLSRIQHQSVFVNFRLDLSDINSMLESCTYLAENQQQILADEVRHKFQKCQQELDNKYQESRTMLEMIFRKQIALFKEVERKSQSKSTVNVLSITGEHDVYLKTLREIYEHELLRLQNQFSSIIKNLQDQQRQLQIQQQISQQHNHSAEKRNVFDSSTHNNITHNSNNSTLNKPSFECSENSLNKHFLQVNSFDSQEIIGTSNSPAQINCSNSLQVPGQLITSMNSNFYKNPAPNCKDKFSHPFSNNENNISNSVYRSSKANSDMVLIKQFPRFETDEAIPPNSNQNAQTPNEIVSCGRNVLTTNNSEINKMSQQNSQQQDQNTRSNIHLSGTQKSNNVNRQSSKENEKQNLNNSLQKALNSSNSSNPLPKKRSNSSKKHFVYTSGIGYVWGSGKDGRLGCCDEKPQKFPKSLQSMQFSSIECGYHHTAAISSQGQLYTWGRGNRGQLGLGNFENVNSPLNLALLNRVLITSVKCGWQHTLALSSQGKVFSWGCGDDGQLGLGEFESCNSPQLVRSLEPLIITQIAAGHSHSAVLSEEGDLYMFGCNLDHRLMIKTNQNQSYPVLTELDKLQDEDGSKIEITNFSLGVNHSAVVTKNGNLYTAGNGNEGQLGFVVYQNSPNVVIVPQDAESCDNSIVNQAEQQNGLECDRLCYLHKVKSFGKQNKALSVSCGDSFTIVINEKYNIFSFGQGSYCRLGHPDITQDENIYEPQLISTLQNEKIINVAAGCRHALALTDDGRVYCWGFNFYDQLGLGDSEKDFSKPTKIIQFSGLNVKGVSAGYFHSAAISF